jgi:transcriptional regulator with XRE-family HTH domain
MPKPSAPSENDRLASSFGKRLAELRAGVGIDATELGRRAGMSQAYIWKLENGRALPNLRTLARLAIAIDQPLVSLLDGVDYTSVELQNRGYHRGAPSPS